MSASESIAERIVRPTSSRTVDNDPNRPDKDTEAFSRTEYIDSLIAKSTSFITTNTECKVSNIPDVLAKATNADTAFAAIEAISPNTFTIEKRADSPPKPVAKPANSLNIAPTTLSTSLAAVNILVNTGRKLLPRTFIVFAKLPVLTYNLAMASIRRSTVGNGNTSENDCFIELKIFPRPFKVLEIDLKSKSLPDKNSTPESLSVSSSSR